MDDALLSVRNLKQYFRLKGSDLKAVDDISFDIRKGEVLGLVGESGCGKTTLGRSIIRLYDITGGDIFFMGKRIGTGIRDKKKKISEARKSGDAVLAERLKAELVKAKDEVESSVGEGVMSKMQMIFQDPIASLNPRMTVREIIAEGLTIRGIRDKRHVNGRVSEALDMVGLLPEHAERYPHEFSGGQRQRIGIARAILLEPEMIIADEPVSALDVSIQAQVINLLNDLRERMGLTILFIAHDLSVVKYFSNRIAVMYFGKIVEMADSEELFLRPLHPYTRALLSAIPQPNPRYERKRKRMIYTPALEHDYTREEPELKEILPGHFVRCSTEELEKYKAELGPA
ncbi:MAG: ATP-binding cassette domain-containing protein [Defluviitaleaceae bacterium]|nr:ATP-binding cassette domain-containing protein [Defluviitaleaceae bacterium]MCL2836117.1 ATP-binding cassette domain-containing protein [Defluviitaleaceae bacterium]